MAAGMTKTQLVRALAEKLEVSNKQAAAFLANLCEIAVKETKKNGVFVLPGLGRLKKSARKARMGRNPQTGAPIKIPAKKAPKFTAGKDFKERVAKGDTEHKWLLPQISFGLLYNRNTTLLNDVNSFFSSGHLPANNLSSGFNIQVPIFDQSIRDKARESAADALRARVEAEQAQRQEDVQIEQITGSLRELDTQAEIASLKQQIAGEELKSVLSQMELGNGAGAQPQLSPEAEQAARIDERQKYEDALEAGLELNKARLNLLRALGHMQDWLNELHTK